MRGCVRGRILRVILVLLAKIHAGSIYARRGKRGGTAYRAPREGHLAACSACRGEARRMGAIGSVLAGSLVLLSTAGTALAGEHAARKALQPFNDLIGTWRATGTPEGTREEKQRGFWTESLTWAWAFKGDDAWLTVTFDKGKHF